MITYNEIREALGKPPGSKLLVIHADDLGLSASVSRACLQSMEQGHVSSGSIMVPCPGFSETVELLKTHQQLDLGIHITLTCEWQSYKWGPVADPTQVPSLVDEHGYFVNDTELFAQKANNKEVAIEISAQIEKAIHAGIKPTHLDSHMMVAYDHMGTFMAYLKAARNYHIPCLLPLEILGNPLVKRLLKIEDIVVDKIIMAYPELIANGISAFYAQTLRGLTPGLHMLLIHPAYADEETLDIMEGHPNWGAAWRHEDLNFFTSKKCHSLLQETGIYVTSWKEISDALNHIH